MLGPSLTVGTKDQEQAGRSMHGMQPKLRALTSHDCQTTVGRITRRRSRKRSVPTPSRRGGSALLHSRSKDSIEVLG